MLDLLALLKQHRFFSFLPHEVVQDIARVSSQYSFGKGGQIFRKHAPADSAFFIVAGEVALHTDTGSRDVYGVGTLLTPQALVRQCTRAVDAVAHTDCVVMTLSRAVYRRVLEETPDYAASLERILIEDAGAVFAATQSVLNRSVR